MTMGNRSKLLKDSVDTYNQYAEKLGLNRIEAVTNGHVNKDMSYIAVSIYKKWFDSGSYIMKKDLFYNELIVKYDEAVEVVCDKIITELILRGLNDIVNNQIKLK